MPHDHNRASRATLLEKAVWLATATTGQVGAEDGTRTRKGLLPADFTYSLRLSSPRSVG